MKKITQKAFTLAEIMIVLTVIGILTAIILPSARNLMPDKNLMKFKKAHNTLLTAINELVNSDKYYLNGDLGITAAGKDIVDTDEMRTYFCNSLADLLNVKKVECNESTGGHSAAVFINGAQNFNTSYLPNEVTQETMKYAKDRLDTVCLQAQTMRQKEIFLPDGVSYYTTSSTGYGSRTTKDEEGNKVGEKRYFTPPNQFPANYADNQGFDVAYKIFCIELDDFSSGEDPFGIGIRADGKILNGTRAEQWLEKDTQQ